MNKLKVLSLLPVLLALLAFVFFLQNMIFCSKVGPRLVCPIEVYFVSKEIGDLATEKIAIENAGDEELLIYNVRTSCSCTGLLVDVDGVLVAADTILLKPKESINAYIQISVRGVPVGSDMHVSIRFLTNEKPDLERTISCVLPAVSGGITIVPSPVSFGPVLMGSEQVRIIEVYDDSVVSRSISSILSANPKLVSISDVHDQNSQATIKHGVGRLIGKYTVSLNTSQVGSIDTKIIVKLDKLRAEVDSVKVFGKVVVPIQVSPDTITLPRRSSNGLTYDFRCVVSCSVGNIKELSFINVPNHFSISEIDTSNINIKMYSILCDHSKFAAPNEDVKSNIRLYAKCDTFEGNVDIQVTVLGKGHSNEK